MPVHDFVVIGSGPNGSIAAHELVTAGASVVMIDAGQEPEDSLVAHLDNLAELPWSQWPEGTKMRLLATSASGIGPKTFFGSEFPYDRGTLGVDYGNVKSRASAGIGGFSTVWGATMLPYLEGAWPVSLSMLWSPVLASAARVARIVGVAGETGPLDMIVPDVGVDHPLPSRSALTAAVRLASFSRQLDSGGMEGLGLPRLAVAPRVSASNPAAGCTSCGLCQIGCVYGHIWSSLVLLRSLVASSTFKHIEGVVRSIGDNGRGPVAVLYEDRVTGATHQVNARRVILAAGPIGTAAILLNSGVIQSGITLQDSQTLFVGGLLDSSLAVQEFNPTLAEGVSIGPGSTPNSYTHAQIYGPSEYLEGRLARTVPFMRLAPRRLRSTVAGRLIVALVYLDGRESSKLLVHRNRDGIVRISARAGLNRTHIRNAIATHTRILAHVGARLLPLSAQVLPAGGGNHLGAGLPMQLEDGRVRPGSGWSDTLGRPLGAGRVHVVDTTVLPSVEAGPVTLMSMANALRIAGELAKGG